MNECKNCGRPIRISIFKGGDWCSELCRKALVNKMMAQKARTKCSYHLEWTDEVGEIDVCDVHGTNSKYGPERGLNRPCLAIEGY